MRKFRYLLVLLFIVFLSLYLIDPTLYSTSFKDLWANLLAGVISVILIDRIVEYYEKQRYDSSIRYTRKRLSRVCTSLASALSPAMVWTDFHQFKMEWEGAIQAEYNKEDWKEYYNRVEQSREKALEEVEYILNNRRDLLDDLQNSIFDLKESLEDSSWKFWLEDDSGKDVWRLYNISILAVKTANEAFKIVRDYDLLENREPHWSEKIGRTAQKNSAKTRQKKN